MQKTSNKTWLWSMQQVARRVMLRSCAARVRGPIRARLLATASARPSDGSSRADHTGFYQFLPLAAAASALCAYGAPDQAFSSSSSSSSSGKGNDESDGVGDSNSSSRPPPSSSPPRRLYYVKEVKKVLEQRLAGYRAQRFQGWVSGPRAKEAAYPLIGVGKEIGGPYCLEVPLPQVCHYAKVIAASVGALAKEGKAIQVHTVQDNAEATLLSFVVLDNKRGSSSTTSSMLDNSRSQGGIGSSSSSSSFLLSCPRSESARLILYRDEGFTDTDVDAAVESYMAAWSSTTTSGGGMGLPDILESFTRRSPGGGVVIGGGGGGGDGSGSTVAQGHDDVAAKLRKLGAEVYDKSSVAMEHLGWDSLAAYDDVKMQVEDTIIQALKHPDTYEMIARYTRQRFESNRPRAVLFEGPPGTGKTLTARIISSLADVPLVYVPVERIMSKWFGESESKLSQIFDTCNSMGGALIFIDEVDALATSRDTGTMHEATRRILSVILQNVEGFRQGSKNVLICATNRKQDLDAALISRFDTCIRFGLPSPQARVEVYRRYAKHLSEPNLMVLSERSSGLSCRDIKEVCENAERRWASKLIRGEEPKDAVLPPLTEYLRAAHARVRMQHSTNTTAREAGKDHHSV